MKKILTEPVSTLQLDRKIKAKLKEQEINTVLELCNYSKMELTKKGLTNVDVNDISICLQLIGLDLKKNHAKKNMTIDNVEKRA